MAVSVATGMALFGAVPEKIGPVLYIDYEDDAYIHELRLGAIIDGAGWEGDTPTIHHLALTGSVRSSVKRIRKAVAEHEVVMIVLDSVGLARGADPNSAGDTIDLFKYLRDIGIPILAIDHVRKEHIEKIKGGKVDPNTVLAFGSQYSMSSARLAWFMREMRTSTPQRKRFNLHNTKYNHVQEQAARSIIMEIDSTEAGVIETVRFAIEGTIELDTPVYAEAGRDMLLKVWSINQEAMTLSQFAQALGATKSTVQRWIEKDQADVAPWFKKLPKQGREIPYALTEVGIVSMSELSEGQNG